MEKLIDAGINSKDFYNYHKIGGYIEKYYPKYKNTETENQWKQNWIRNQVYLNELNDLSVAFDNRKTKVILLKGIYLIQNLYKDYGTRFLSDIDLLIPKSSLENVIESLKEHNYELIDQEKWFADDFKYIFSKNVGKIEVTIEVHTALYWDKDRFPEIQKFKDGFYFTLTPEECFVHLCGHYGFTHTYSKLYWLTDIYEFYKKNHQKLDWFLVHSIATKDCKYNSVLQSLYILKEHTDIEVSPDIDDLFKLSNSYLWKKLLSQKQILSTDHDSKEFLLLKQFCKDHLHENIKYNLGWIYNSVKKRFFSK